MENIDLCLSDQPERFRVRFAYHAQIFPKTSH